MPREESAGPDGKMARESGTGRAPALIQEHEHACRRQGSVGRNELAQLLGYEFLGHNQAIQKHKHPCFRMGAWPETPGRQETVGSAWFNVAGELSARSQERGRRESVDDQWQISLPVWSKEIP